LSPKKTTTEPTKVSVDPTTNVTANSFTSQYVLDIAKRLGIAPLRVRCELSLREKKDGFLLDVEVDGKDLTGRQSRIVMEYLKETFPVPTASTTSTPKRSRRTPSTTAAQEAPQGSRTISKPFEILVAKMSPDGQERAKARTREMMLDMNLQELWLRRAELTHEDVAKLLDVTQAFVLKLSGRG
jgi:hypothetical protein